VWHFKLLVQEKKLQNAKHFAKQLWRMYSGVTKANAADDAIPAVFP
jgi:hypothetical protein